MLCVISCERDHSQCSRTTLWCQCNCLDSKVILPERKFSGKRRLSRERVCPWPSLPRCDQNSLGSVLSVSRTDSYSSADTFKWIYPHTMWACEGLSQVSVVSQSSMFTLMDGAFFTPVCANAYDCDFACQCLYCIYLWDQKNSQLWIL